MSDADIGKVYGRTFGMWLMKLLVCPWRGHEPLMLNDDSDAEITVCIACWTVVPRVRWRA